MFLRKFSYPTKLIRTRYTVEKHQEILYISFSYSSYTVNLSGFLFIHYVAVTLFIYYVIEMNESVNYFNKRSKNRRL